VLRRLAERQLFFDLDASKAHPLVALPELGLRVGAALSKRAGANRERAVDEASAELMRRCGLASLRGFSSDERDAWRLMAPLLVRLELGRWPRDELGALADLVRAKGGRSERDFVAHYLAHPRLEAALLCWMRAPAE
jgi:hypothetical protein